MAPNLAKSQRRKIREMINNGSLTNGQIADVALCSARTITTHRGKILRFGSADAPRNRSGRPRSITERMGDAFQQFLLEVPGSSVEELVEFLRKNFGTPSTPSTISRYLKSIGWSKRKPRRVAKERNPDLRDAYLHKLSYFHSYHLVYVDESGCDKRIGFRRTAWAPIGVTPVQIAKFHRGQRYQIGFPAHTGVSGLYRRFGF
jgi:transposase